jgi:hypothetical protein
MTQKLTEEKQRAAHKVIVANRGDCSKGDNFLYCDECPWFRNSCSGNISNYLPLEKFQAENLRRSQAWLDAHITDAEIMAETPKEFCERMVRTEGYGRCFAMIKTNHSLCKACVLSVNECPCNPYECLERSKAYLASHPATPQEPPKRRPTPEEMVVGATVRVRLWDELVKDGKLNDLGHILFPTTYSTIYFNKEMRQYCGTTHKIIVGGPSSHLDGCGDWTFIPEMLDYVEPEKVVNPKPVANAPKPEAKEKGDATVKGDVDWTSLIAKQFEFERALVTKSIVKGKVDNLPPGLHFLNFMDLFPVDAKRIVELEKFVKNLTRELNASTRKCDRLQRRLRAKWEAKRDGEMATREEIIAWFDAGRGAAMINGSTSQIRLKNRTDWIPATRGNLKL